MKRGRKARLIESVTGKLKGYDGLMNLVLDDVQEVVRGEWWVLGRERG